jgi:hypothetical protein
MAQKAKVLVAPVRRKRQVFVLAPEGTKLFRAWEQERVITRDVQGLPLPCWPDGSWCIEFAEYMYVLAKKGLSLADRGGTPGSYAYELSHLVRYCYAKKTDFHQLSDAQFVEFIGGLSEEKHKNGEHVRKSRRVVEIGRRSLAFLDFIGKRWNIPDFLSLDGSHIFAEKKSYEVMLSSGNKVTRHYWHHSCFPKLSPLNRRFPVPEDYINRLRKAVGGVKSSSFLRRRRLTLLRVLEATGARRIEIVNLRVTDVLAAMSMEKPYLRVPTYKKRGGEPEYRMIPIEHSEIIYLVEYIRFYRNTVLSNKGIKEDHGFLFVNEKTGKPIKPNTITLEIHALRKAAGIEGKAHPHLFRHRYITMAIYRLVRAYKVRDKDHFAELLITAEDFARDVMERTGHGDINSLWRYVHWAFALSGAVEGNLDEVQLSELARGGRASVTELEALKATMSAEDFAEETMKRMKELVQDMSKVDGEKRSVDPVTRLRDAFRR